MTRNQERKINELDEMVDKQRIKEKNSEDKDAYQRVFDARTISTLRKLLNTGVISKLVGIISQGKEANVYFAYGAQQESLAIKIYKIDIQSARWMKNYIKGDPRFKKIGSNPDQIIFMWCQKEFRNLKQIDNADLPCPIPLHFKNNVLVMTFIGNADGTPARKLKECVSLFQNPAKELETSLDYIDRLYRTAHLVHADLSEFNILYHESKQILIDVSQAVSIAHPKAKQYLARDIRNIINFYSRMDVPIPDPMEIYTNIIEKGHKSDE
ncbi:MAG: serine protein kinase RIO [Candidatus Lokiarchaeota archaeon]|nr:serine protein kinase RIO [Candidatus Lokiarchaeota archaeon]